MPTIIKIKERQADKLYECAEKVHRGAKKLMEFIEDEILESEEFDERYGGGGNGGGTGGYRDEEMTMMRTTMSAEVYLALVDMVVVDTVEDAAINN